MASIASSLPIEVWELIAEKMDTCSLVEFIKVNRVAHRAGVRKLWRRLPLTSFISKSRDRDGITKVEIQAGKLLDVVEVLEGRRVDSMQFRSYRSPGSGITTARQLKRKMSSVVDDQDSLTPNKLARLTRRRSSRSSSSSSDDAMDVDEDTVTSIELLETTCDYSRLIKEVSCAPADDARPHPLAFPNSILRRLVGSLSRCQVFDLSVCVGLDDGVLEVMASRAGPWLKELSLAYCSQVSDYGLVPLVMKVPLLEVIKLEGCPLVKDKTVVALSDSCPRLKAINLRNCRSVTGASLVRLSERCPALEHVNFCGVQLLERELKVVFENCAQLRSVDLAGIGSVTDAVVGVLVQNSPNLNYLSIQRCERITDTSILHLAQLKFLERLDLTNLEQITNEGLIKLLKKRGKCLREIFLARCMSITNEAVIALADNCPKMDRIYLAGLIHVTDEAIIKVISQCKNLSVLSVPGCGITDASVLAACELASTLEVAQFSFCEQVTEFAVGRLCYDCPKLTIVQLVGCYRILSSYIFQYSIKCPSNTSYPENLFCALRRPNIARVGAHWSHIHNSNSSV